jgi:putative hemolysin
VNRLLVILPAGEWRVVKSHGLPAIIWKWSIGASLIGASATALSKPINRLISAHADFETEMAERRIAAFVYPQQRSGRAHVRRCLVPRP